MNIVNIISIHCRLPNNGGNHPLESSIHPFTPLLLELDAFQADPADLSPIRADDAADGRALCAGPRTDAPRPSRVATLMI